MRNANPTALLSSLGLRVSKVFNLKRGVMTGFADVAYKYESKDRLNVNTRFAAVDAPGPTVVIEDFDKDFGTAAIGATWIFPNGNQYVREVRYAV
ncbi:MAG: autotransporter domain-containing protein [Gammaproteobacteria bacterium]|nr:autotransporter domain-containing protein [Gammaproteobacteria bacterium]